ncbi:hypothetical protein [Xanthocytophaga flava]|uniref:hypothetical protein n=1 Tax=Xanthocytophaga flava TaxID=3048013 RepID=UPI0028D4C7A7|nr:hypothetical protein [Xanthocytophaga flavus]MDJ1471375.1 hypothetical protein [Xanthocytophaga flavus]
MIVIIRPSFRINPIMVCGKPGAHVGAPLHGSEYHKHGLWERGRSANRPYKYNHTQHHYSNTNNTTHYSP